MLDSFDIASELLGSPRKAWVQPPLSGNASDCLIFLDGELYTDRVKAPEVIRDLHKSGSLPPVSAVYLSYLDTAARHADFTCNETFSQFASAVLPAWIERNIRHHDRYFLCGLSLSGLSAAFTAFQHPGVFSGILCQSPSAWWNDEWLSASLTCAGPRSGRFWISAGNQEIEECVSHPPTGLFQKASQIDSVRRLAQRLDGLCKDLRYNEFSGGHDPSCWADELPRALPWLMQSI